MVQHFWEPQVPVRQRVVSGSDGFPRAFAVTRADGSTLVGLYNGSDIEAEVSVGLSELGLQNELDLLREPVLQSAADGDVSAWPGEGVRLVAGRLDGAAIYSLSAQPGQASGR